MTSLEVVPNTRLIRRAAVGLASDLKCLIRICSKVGRAQGEMVQSPPPKTEVLITKNAHIMAETLNCLRSSLEHVAHS